MIESTLDSYAMSFGGKCRRVYGFYAGSGYPQIGVWDSATVIPEVRYIYSDEFLRLWMEDFFINQAEDGSMEDYISPMGCDKNTVETDQETSLVHSAYQYYKISGNNSWLLKEIDGKTIIVRLDDSLRYVLKYRYNTTYGLVTGAFTADWGDVQFEDSPGTDITNQTHWTCDIYDNSMFYRACEELSILYSELECKENAAFWSSAAQSIKASTNKYLWQPDMGFYKMHVFNSRKTRFYRVQYVSNGRKCNSNKSWSCKQHAGKSNIHGCRGKEKRGKCYYHRVCIVSPPIQKDSLPTQSWMRNTNIKTVGSGIALQED